jgi:hypothetical protein
MKAASSPAAKKRTMKTIGKALDLSGWPAGKQGYFLSVSMQTYCPSQEKYLF